MGILSKWFECKKLKKKLAEITAERNKLVNECIASHSETLRYMQKYSKLQDEHIALSKKFSEHITKSINERKEYLDLLKQTGAEHGKV